MNEKISEFINVAARQFEQEAGSDTMRLYYDRAMEIFAELIIKECLNIIDDVCDSWNNPEWRILEHFGIDHDWRNIDKNILQLDIALTQDQMYNIVIEEINVIGKTISKKNVDLKVESSIVIGNLEVASKDLNGRYNLYEAVAACEELGDGWRLPTKDELNEIYKNKDTIGGFVGDCYWSSTVYGDYSAWFQRFSDGSQSFGFKCYEGDSVRPVRNI